MESVSKLFKVSVITSSFFILWLGFTGCTPTVFGVPESEWKQMNPAQQEAQVQIYNANQQRAAEEKPLWDSLGVLISAAGNTPRVQQATTHQHCTNNSPPPVCTTNPDGSIHCTQKSSGSCTSFGL